MSEQQSSSPGEERRRFYRLEISLPVQGVDVRGSKHHFQTHDLSAGGTLLHSAEPLDANTYLKLSIGLEASKQAVSAIGLIKRVVRHKVGFRLAVEFIEMSEEDQDKIARFINARILELRRQGRI